MMQNNEVKKSKYHQVDPQSLYFKLFLIYDIFMVFLIIFNLFCLCANFFIMSNIGGWFFHAIHLESVLSFYREHLHPWVITTEAWSTNGIKISSHLVKKRVRGIRVKPKYWLTVVSTQL
jgi:hypothetical protein